MCVCVCRWSSAQHGREVRWSSLVKCPARWSSAQHCRQVRWSSLVKCPARSSSSVCGGQVSAQVPNGVVNCLIKVYVKSRRQNRSPPEFFAASSQSLRNLTYPDLLMFKVGGKIEFWLFYVQSRSQNRCVTILNLYMGGERGGRGTDKLPPSPHASTDASPHASTDVLPM